MVLREAGRRGEGEAEDEIVVESRGTGCDANWGTGSRTNWQVVLPLLDCRPMTVAAGQVVTAQFSVELPAKVDEPVRYAIDCA